MFKKRFLLFIFFIILSCSLKEKVKVNIIGYTKLKAFEINLNKKSNVLLDNKRIATSGIKLFPHLKIVEVNGIRLKFSRIKIIANGIVSFNSKHGDQNYKGDFIITPENESISIINSIDIDEYFASVLGSEMGGSFSDETLKAQAIIIRTYYYSRKKEYKKERYDINNADGRDIVYRGSDFATKKVFNIMEETKDLFLTDRKDNLVLPLFHSTSCGIILKDEVLRSKIDDNLSTPVLAYDLDGSGNLLSKDSPYFAFSERISDRDLIKIINQLLKIENIKGIEIKYFNNTECVDFIGFKDEKDNISWIKAYKFLSLAQRSGFNNLRSIRFDIDRVGDEYIFTGTGFGHLCGMSQYSAERLSKNGLNYKEILKFYYPDCRIVKKKRFIFF